MKKRFALPACACLLALLSGCSPSPEAITVDGRDVDAAELAFYMEYNRLNLENRTAPPRRTGPTTNRPLNRSKKNPWTRSSPQRWCWKSAKNTGWS